MSCMYKNSILHCTRTSWASMVRLFLSFPFVTHFFGASSAYFFCHNNLFHITLPKYQLNYSRKGLCSNEKQFNCLFGSFVFVGFRLLCAIYPGQRFVSTKYVLNGSQTKRNQINNNNDVT